MPPRATPSLSSRASAELKALVAKPCTVKSRVTLFRNPGLSSTTITTVGGVAMSCCPARAETLSAPVDNFSHDGVQ